MISAEIEHNLNASMNATTDWCRAYDMFVHANKSESMLITFKAKKEKYFLGINSIYFSITIP